MGCVHSSGAGGVKARGSDTDTGVHFQADPKVHPEILQLAELAKAGTHAFTERSFKRRQFKLENCSELNRRCEIYLYFCTGPVILVVPQHGSIKSTPQKKRSSITR
ncbi:hypothetical protein fugu_004744 [Takifugu bimaculatus]|uniref:Uncharacterized protein n=1 Tax=Takifugu bimaculatus TaxID=433685 RepID=A0A4Z2BBN5_9TELE|nr:hypothetical protein fugu_004744 [Takifugu bimaculatus]